VRGSGKADGGNGDVEDGYGGEGFEGLVVEVFRCGSSGEVEVGEKCGFGWTAPRERSWAAKAGSSASRFVAGRLGISAECWISSTEGKG
jgi:hypothetical protein